MKSDSLTLPSPDIDQKRRAWEWKPLLRRVYLNFHRRIVKDTLCWNEVLLRTDYERLSGSRFYFAESDPFGDFNLLFGAAKLNLKIADVPYSLLRPRRRSYEYLALGDTAGSCFAWLWCSEQLKFV